MNFPPHTHEKVLIAGSKKRRHRIRTVQNQKMGTTKLSKLGSKKRENKKTHMEGFSPKNTRITHNLPRDGFRRLRLSDEIGVGRGLREKQRRVG